jgi:hypothetical protein
LAIHKSLALGQVCRKCHASFVVSLSELIENQSEKTRSTGDHSFYDRTITRQSEE